MGDDYFRNQIQASERKHTLAIGGIAIFAALGTATAAWWGKKNRKKNIEKTVAALGECNAAIDAESRYFADLVTVDYCVLDSNVWMAPEAEALLHLLNVYAGEFGGTVCVLKAQIAEIDNLKNPRKGSASKYNEGPHGRARHATRRMNEFRKAGLLRVVDDTAVAAGRTHADEIFFDYFLHAVPKSATIRFVTGDGGLALKMLTVEAARQGRYQTIDRDPLLSRADSLGFLHRKRRILEEDLKRLQGDALQLPAPAGASR